MSSSKPSSSVSASPSGDPGLMQDRRTAQQAEDQPVLALPSPSVPIGEEEPLSELSADELQARLLARRRDIQFRIEAIKQEVVQIGEDVNVGGRPLMDRVRERPWAVLGLAAAGGATLGLLWGLGKRARRMPDPDLASDVIRVHTAALLESAAKRVSRGASLDDALAEEARRRPVVFVPADEQPVAKQAASSTRQVVDTALKTAVGIGVKTGLDQLTQRLTGHEEVFNALEDAAEDA